MSAQNNVWIVHEASPEVNSDKLYHRVAVFLAKQEAEKTL